MRHALVDPDEHIEPRDLALATAEKGAALDENHKARAELLESANVERKAGGK